MAKKRPFLKGFIALSCMILSFSCHFFSAEAQSLRNEWIDYNKTYYRFAVVPSVPTTGTPSNHANTADYNKLHRITYNNLQGIGLENTPVEHLQLWRNGAQVPVYITQSSGPLSTEGFIEFWGRANDGATDLDLYRFPIYQTNDRWSMFSDTAYYYLTVNTAGPNLRINEVAHDPLNSPLTADSFFLHTIQINPKASRNLGFALNISNTEVRSASWDAGEGWGDARFGGTAYTVGLGKLYAYKKTDSTIRASFWSQGMTNRNQTIQFRLNDSIIGSKSFRRYASDSIAAAR